MRRLAPIVTLGLMVPYWSAAAPVYGQRPAPQEGARRSAPPPLGVSDRTRLPLTLQQFPFSSTGSAVTETPANPPESRGLKPAARNTETGNALAPLEATTSTAPTATVPKEAAKVRVLDFELTEMSDGALAANAVQDRHARPLVVLSDQEIARASGPGASGTSGSGGAEAIVYENTEDTANWTVNRQRFSFTPTMSSTVVNSAGFSIPTNLGTFIADDMTPGGGWQLGDPISSFSAFVRRSGTDQTRFIGDGTARATVTLWDGDPINLVDTTGDGFASAPIPGASCDFTLSPDVPFSTLQNLKCDLATPITPAHGTVWMVLTSDSCRLFWSITLRKATVGDSRDLGILGQDDDAGTLGSLGGPSTAATDGTCCNDGGGTTCGPTGVAVDCPGDVGNAGGRCSDGDAETHLRFNFGGPCTGDPATDSCVNYLAQINTPTATTMSVVPVGATGPHAIDGNTITAQPGSTVILEVRLAGWDPDGDGSAKLKAWTVCLEDPDATGQIVPVSQTCTTDADCFSLFGGVCTITGESCNQDTDCVAAPIESCASRSKCVTSYGPPQCEGGFIDDLRSDYVFFGLNELAAVAFSSFDCRAASVLTAAADAVTDPGVPRYAVTVGVEVSPDAVGEFTFGIQDAVSSLIDENNAFIPLVGFVPTTIIVATDPFLNVRKNRYLTVTAGQPGVSQAIRVKFVDLPGAFSVLNGSSRWVGSPFDISENGASRGPDVAGFADFKAASLRCDPFFMDWSTIGGVVQVLHEDIVPSGTYEIAVFNESNPTVIVSSSTTVMGKWGDLVGPFDQENQVWSAPDGSVGVVEIVAMIQSFESRATMPRKVRMDVDPGTPNGGIDVLDIVRVLDAFRGFPYPFAPTRPPCVP